MRIYNNVNAIAIQNTLDNTNTAMAKSLEKLSTGLRINRASDDAAGLSVSEGLRTQIRQCVETANEVELRKLSGNTLLCFVLFAQDTGAGSSRPEIIRMARELLPAELLKQAQADTSGR